MCEICIGICEYIENTFGHRVDPKRLEELIESSPVVIPDEHFSK